MNYFTNKYNILGLEGVPSTVGIYYVAQTKLKYRLMEEAMRKGFVPMDCPEIMPVRFLDQKFAKYSTPIKLPGISSEDFILTTEGMIPAILLAVNGGPKRICYPDSACYRGEDKDGKIELQRFTQFGIEIYGDQSIKADADTIEVAYSLLTKSGLEPEEDFEFLLNDIQGLRNYLEKIGIRNDKEFEIGEKKYRRQNYVIKALDDAASDFRKTGSKADLDKINSEFRQKLEDKRVAVSPDAIEVLNDLVYAKAYSEIPNELSKFYEKNLEEIQQIENDLKERGVKASIVPNIFRGLSYYKIKNGRSSCFVFEAVSNGKGREGSQLLGGGRYDGMIGEFFPEKKDTDMDFAIGFGLGIERVLEKLCEKYGSLEKAMEVL